MEVVSFFLLILPEWYLVIILFLLLGLSFGHVFEKSLEKKHFKSYSLGFFLAILPSILLIMIFSFLSAFLEFEASLFYHITYVIIISVAIHHLYLHMSGKNKD